MKTNVIYAVLLALILAACSSAKITSSWKSTVAGKSFNKIMVVGLIKESDRTVRERMEQHMIGDLKELGYDAVSAYDVYGPKAFDNLDENATLEKLKSSNVDAVITIVLLNKEKETFYKPGVIIRTPYANRYNRFWGYYTTINDRIYSPGYYETTTKYFWESNFYDLTSKELLYSVQTQSFDPSSKESLAHDYGKMIVADMVKKAVLLKK